MTALKTIYDFGSNNGDDIPYYLLRADRVVAVEANPELCKVIHARFADQIASGRVIVVNCVLADDESRTETPFYIHNTRHVCSQLPKPVKHLSDFTEVTLPCATAASIIAKHGPAYYIKIDIERYDGPILRNLFMHDVVPPYISAEAHDVSVFAILVALGGYNAFKLVDGASVAELYKGRRLSTEGVEVVYDFPNHSAGPFGDDIDGPWMTANAFARVLAYEGQGWKDVHATNRAVADPAATPSELAYCYRVIGESIRAGVNRPIRRMRSIGSRLKAQVSRIFRA